VAAQCIAAGLAKPEYFRQKPLGIRGIGHHDGQHATFRFKGACGLREHIGLTCAMQGRKDKSIA
jgi:hypothetical protein